MEKIKRCIESLHGYSARACLLLLGCSGFMLFSLANYMDQQDKTPPVITHSIEVPEYIMGEDVSILLKDVQAMDLEDGDVTTELRIRSITVSDDFDDGVVTYVAKDRANNVTALKRSITVMHEEEESEIEADSETAKNAEEESKAEANLETATDENSQTEKESANKKGSQ